MSLTPAYPTSTLLNAKAFTTPAYSLNIHDRARLSYDRAKSIALAYELTIDDIVPPSQRFWDMHQDPIFTIDTSALTLLSIQFNLCAGTIASYADKRPELRALVDDLLQYRKHGQFMLTEVGHGLDIHNIETTATRLPSGEFIFNSPTPSAAKFMPPTIPAGTPCIAVVFARLVVDGEYRGMRPFVVPLNDGFEMCRGVVARLLPDRGGPDPVNHSITSFHSVRLPATALLGSLEKPVSFHDHLLDITSRICIGTMAFSHSAVPFMQSYATLGALYSLRRKTGDPAKPQPILQFRTQQLPIVHAVAQVHVLSAYEKWATDVFMTASDHRIRRGIAAISKALGVQHSQVASMSISERCGAQGLFAHNRMTALHNMMRGIAIAEGDILGLSIKLANELLLGRYTLPATRDANSPLARHEAALLEEARVILKEAGHHRSPDMNRLMLPRCQPLVEAIGHRMAYDAAIAAGVSRSLVDLYVASVMKLDAAWYSECTAFGRRAQQELETHACDVVLPKLRALVDAMGVVPYISAPIVSDAKWAAFVTSLPVYERSEEVDLGLGEKGAHSSVRAHL